MLVRFLWCKDQDGWWKRIWRGQIWNLQWKLLKETHIRTCWGSPNLKTHTNPRLHPSTYWLVNTWKGACPSLAPHPWSAQTANPTRLKLPASAVLLQILAHIQITHRACWATDCGNPPRVSDSVGLEWCQQGGLLTDFWWYWCWCWWSYTLKTAVLWHQGNVPFQKDFPSTPAPLPSLPSLTAHAN